ncbi:MAG: OmpA family protein [Pseudomonadota bacterium]
MVKKYFKAALILSLGIFLMSCAVPKSGTQDWRTTFTPLDLNSKVKSGEYVKDVDNFLVILDASGSMAETQKGKTKLNLAKDMVSRMNQTIPDLGLTGGLRIFGRTAFWPLQDSKLIYGLTAYSKGGLEDSLNMVACGRGVSPMELALNGAAQDLKAVSGKIAVIVFSDGDEEDMNYAAAINSAKSLKGQFGNRLCIYTVLIGNDPDGKKLLEKIADAGQCGFAVTADQIESSGGMAGFVEKVFLAKAPAKPAPAMAPPKPVTRAAPLDSDGDGVYDNVDRCPGTPLGAKVDQYGCWIIKNVLFDFDRSKIKPQYSAILDEVAAVLKRNPGLKMVIEGHTDSIGTGKYNNRLSVKRAKKVMEYLANKGASKNQLSINGYGLTRPIATNLTKEGRALNRRAELKRVMQ